MGPTASKPGPMLLKQAKTAEIFVPVEKPSREISRKLTTEYPVFLFDDVLSELDEGRRKFVLDGIGEKQIIITSCEKDSDGLTAQNKIEVNSGSYLGS